VVATPTVDTITAAARILNLIFDLPSQRLFKLQHDDTNTKQPLLKAQDAARGPAGIAAMARHRDRLRDTNSYQLSDGTIPATPAPTASRGSHALAACPRNPDRILPSSDLLLAG
jgi:hypothetical protein